MRELRTAPAGYLSSLPAHPAHSFPVSLSGPPASITAWAAWRRLDPRPQAHWRGLPVLPPTPGCEPHRPPKGGTVELGGRRFGGDRVTV